MGNKREITDADVELYLLDNLDFFKSRESLVAELEFKDPISGASSLLEKQVKKLRAEQNTLAELLNKFLINAFENEMLFNNTRALLLKALDCKKTKDLFQTAENYFSQIEGIDFCGCGFFDKKEQEIIEEALGKVLESKNVFIGSFSFEKAQMIFGDKDLRSGVIAVSRCSKKSILIKLGSKDGSRYIGDEGTTFIDYVLEVLGAIASKIDG
ncbi:MAG: DUF484 family protein [Gammaproteobacteria bacterium]